MSGESGDHESIGMAVKLNTEEMLEPEKGISFEFQYGEDAYGLTFSAAEMDRMFRNGVEQMLGNRALGSYDYLLHLGLGELPLFVGPRTIEVPPNPDGYHDALMETNIVTWAQASHLEQRGILRTRRHSWDGSWEFARYDVQPELREPEAALSGRA